jgi:hypothetical protein
LVLIDFDHPEVVEMDTKVMDGGECERAPGKAPRVLLEFGHLRAQPALDCGGLTPPSHNRTQAFPEAGRKVEVKID